MLKVILLIILWLLYWAIKGLVIKTRGVKVGFMIATSLLMGIMFWLGLSFHPATASVLIIYLLISYVEYVLTCFNVKVPIMLVYSYIRVINEEVAIRYSIFKPLVLLIADIILIFKRAPMLGFSDTLEVDVNSRDNVQVNIRI